MPATPGPPGGRAEAAAVSAAKTAPLTFETAVVRALAWHPAIDEAVGQIYRAEERIAEAKAGYYPKISAGVDSGYRSTSGWGPRLNVSASQMIYDFGKAASSVDTQAAGRNVADARLLLATDTLARDTAQAVIELQRYRRLSRLAQEQLNGVQAIARLVKERSDRGASTTSDRVQADARVEAALATKLQYDSERERWQASLSALLGGGPANPSDDVPAWLARSCDPGSPDWSQVPAMLEAEAQKEEAAAQLKASRAEAFPTISLEGGVGYDILGSKGSSDDLDPSIGVNVSWSLFNGGQLGARARAAGHALRAAEASLLNTRFEVERSFLEGRSRAGTLGRLRDTLQSRYDMMVQTRDLYRHQYLELGTRTLLDLLNAEQELHEAQFQTANTVHDLRRLHVDCLYNTGRMRQSFGVEAAALRGRGSG
ncbi:TolC family protein [Rhizobiaceae bacterium BDR2-2]|uniref:TolC family protein n=1 Tax=Ectorhizobium quercum TaxID=2965071 RepID=A0AAE3MWB7_9HYPH|nr:TolC family protein [Ectorhizobium quercum]MCX8995491.1 TolC family protein [Ectorhizobium quercum]